jgi:Tfp pilus assembly protein PilX
MDFLQMISGFFGFGQAGQTPANTGQAPATTGQTPAAGAQGPGLMGNMSMGLSIGQAIGSVYSAFAQASATKYALNKQAQIMEDNRQIAQMGAESAFRAGEAQIAQLTYKAGQRKAAQRSSFAANGVALGNGSVAEVLASGDIMKEIDKDTAQMNALANAWGYKRQASQYAIQSGVAGIKAGATSGWGGAASGLLEHGTAVADRWYRYYGNGSNK